MEMSSADASLPTDESDLPERIGPFRVDSGIGQGSFGIVLLGFDERLDRQVAIKVPRIQWAIEADHRKRFSREAAAAATLSHPHVLPIYEYGQDGPMPYMALEYCPQGTLQSFLSRTKTELSPRQIARIVARLADAIQHAHSRNIMHRDIKPDNVLISGSHDSDDLFADAIESLVKISDFGLAGWSESNHLATLSKTMMGTPAYMSPEQARSESPTPAMDVYGLGGVLYWLLCRQPPIDGASTLDCLNRLQSEKPVHPCRLNQNADRDLSAIAMKCLEKRDHDRYVSARQLGDDLERYVEGRPTLARPVGTLRSTSRWIRQNPVLAALTGALLLALTSLFVGGWYVAGQMRRSRDDARVLVDQLQRQLESRTRDEYAAAWTDVIERGTPTPHAYHLRGENYYLAGRLEDSYNDMLAAHRLDPDYGWGQYYLAFYQLCGPASLRDEQSGIAHAKAVQTRLPDIALVEIIHAVALYREGDFGRAAAELSELSEQPVPGAKTHLYLFLAMSRAQLGHHREAREMFDRATSHFEQTWDMRFELYEGLRDEAAALLVTQE